METNTCSAKYNYRISPFSNLDYSGRWVNYTRGAFHLSKTGRFVAYEHSIDASDLEILIEGCKNDHSGVEPWMGDCNADFWDSLENYLQDGCVVCEICEAELHAKENR